MSDFARQQDEFQRGILAGDDKVLGEILDSPQEKRETLFGVYRYAYGSRLVDALRNDHELLHAYLGDEMFDEMGHAYVKAKPSHHPNLRWFSQGLPEFLKANTPYSDYPVLADLAALEKALNDAFDGTDGAVLTLADVSAVPPEKWNDLVFTPHPTAARLDHATNASAIWRALKNNETPPDAVSTDEPMRLLVWRQDSTPMFRELSTEEAMMWDEATSGIPFGVLCSMLATYADPDTAAARGAGYLHGWVTGGLFDARFRRRLKGQCMGIAAERYFVEHMTWDSVARRIDAGAAAILPVGAGAKQHGLHLPLNTDRIQAEYLARHLAADIDALVWPTLNYGHYPAFVDYAGSTSLSAATFEAVVAEIASDILRHGCRALFVLDTGISTRTAITQALARPELGNALHLKVHDGPRYVSAAAELAEQRHGSHADELETSLMVAIAPELIDMSRAEASPPIARETPGRLTPTDKASPNYSRSGSFGDPTLATRAKGELLLAAIVDDITDQAKNFLAQLARPTPRARGAAS